LALLTCHTCYQNSFLLFAIGVAGACACAFCRLWRRALLILTICFFAAVSMLVYVPSQYAYRAGSQIQITDMNLFTIVNSLAEAVSGGNTALLFLWMILASAGLVGLTVQAKRRRESASEGKTPSLAAYCLIAAVVANIVGLTFFRVYSCMTYAWHWTPLVAVSAIAVEVAFQSRRNDTRLWSVRIGSACMAIALSLPALWEAAHLRRTNLDCVGSVLAERASPEDFILLNGFWLAPGFQHHFHGKTEWNAVPLIPNEREVKIAPYTAIKEQMMTRDAIVPTLRKIDATLSSGHRLWIVDILPMSPSNTPPPILPPAPQSEYGWNISAYAQAWSKQAGFHIQRHARTIRTIPVDTPDPVNSLENVSLILVEGWKGP
jgi:hypothetical protein